MIGRSNNLNLGGEVTRGYRMRVHLVSLFALLMATTLLAAQPVPMTDEYAKKMKAIQNQIDELRKQQEALRQEQDQAQKEKAPTANGNAYAKVELRGKLVMTPGGTRINERNQKERLDRWHVAVGDVLHPIRLSQQQMGLADTYVDKEVIVHGVLESHQVKLFRP